MEEWRWAKAADLGRGIAAGDIDPVDLTDAYLDAIDGSDARDVIYARATPERARAEALGARARAASGQRLSPLDGVPISWKDLFDTAGIGTEAGTAMMKGRVPHQDAEVLRRAGAAGLVCLGKTHLSEIAFSGLGLNPVTATSPNMHDPDLVAGGSSSGSAASVAYGLAPASIGTDTGGSVRIPSAWNDLVGLKTTHGLIPNDGVVALCETFDTTGPLTRSVEDASLLLSILAAQPAPDLKGARLSGTRLLVIDTILTDDVDPAASDAFETALGKLSAAGAAIDRKPFAPLQDAYSLAGPLFTADAWSEWQDAVNDRGDLMYHHIRERVSAGADVGAADYLAAWRNLMRLRAEYDAFTAPYDAVVCPAAPILPPRIDRLLSEDEYYVEANLKALRNTRLGNLMGLCSLTLPTGFASCGVLLNASPGSEARLLRLGKAAETALS